MKNSNNISDQELSQLFLGAQMDFDQTQMWQELQAPLKRKWRIPFWVFGSALIVFLATSIMLFQLNKKDSTAKTDNHLSATTTDHAHQPESAEQHIALPASEPNRLTSNAVQPKADLKIASSSETTALATKKDKQVISKNIPRTDKNHASKLASVNTSTATEVPTKNQSSIIVPPTESTTSKAITAIDHSSRAQTIGDVVQEEQKTLLKLPYLGMSDFNLVKANTGNLTPSENRTGPSKWSVCRVSNPWLFKIEAFGGYSYPIISNNLNSSSENGNTAYLNKWNDERSTVGGYQAGLKFLTQAPFGLEIGLGVAYQQLTEKLSTDLTITQTLRIYDPMAYFYTDANGARVWVGDTVTRTVVNQQTQTKGSYHRLINIPLHLGYYYASNYWNIGIQAGINFHLRYTFKGTIYGPTGQYVDLDKSNQDVFYKTSLGLSYFAALHFGRMLNDHWEVFIRPQFTYHPGSWAANDSPLNIKIQLPSINAGVRYTF